MSTPIAQALTVSGTEAAVCADIARRQQLGIKKYGVSVAENPLPLRAWLQHAYEETLDQAVYLKRAIEELDGDGGKRSFQQAFLNQPGN